MKNILFICTDQHRKDTLQIYCDTTPCETPNITSIANNGVVFDNCYCSNPVCTPARSSIQTGLFPSKTGMNSNSFELGSTAHELIDNPKLLSRQLKSNGYDPSFTGKWHLGEELEHKISWGNDSLDKGEFTQYLYRYNKSLPTDLGYSGDDFPGHGNGGWQYSQFLNSLENKGIELSIENIKRGERDGDHSTTGEVTSGIESTIEHYLVERSIQLIDNQIKNGKPFVHQLNFWGPHEPFFPPIEYYNKYKDLEIKPWLSFKEENLEMYNILKRPEVNWDFFENTLKHYYAYVEYMDFEIGRLINYLKDHGVYDDTLIIFTSDHGDYQGVHGAMENKSYGMYDDITNIPLVIKPPIKNFSPKRSKALVGTCDFYTTILDALDIDYPQTDGRSLIPVLYEEVDENFTEIVTEGMGAFPAVCTQRMYRNKKYKYVINFGTTEQLFDLENDPLEMTNLILDESRADVICDIRKDFASWMKRNGDRFYMPFCKMFKINDWSLNEK